jgi:hypothetical protein
MVRQNGLITMVWSVVREVLDHEILETWITKSWITRSWIMRSWITKSWNMDRENLDHEIMDHEEYHTHHESQVTRSWDLYRKISSEINNKTMQGTRKEYLTQ